MFSKNHIHTLVVDDVKGLEGLKKKLQLALQGGVQNINTVLDHLPQVVLYGDNPLYWKNTNTNANHAHFSEDHYEKMFS